MLKKLYGFITQNPPQTYVHLKRNSMISEFYSQQKRTVLLKSCREILQLWINSESHKSVWRDELIKCEKKVTEIFTNYFVCSAGSGVGGLLLVLRKSVFSTIVELLTVFGFFHGLRWTSQSDDTVVRVSVIQYINQSSVWWKINSVLQRVLSPTSLSHTHSVESVSTSRCQCHFVSAALALDSVSAGRHTHPVSVGTQPVTIHIPGDNSEGKPIARPCDSTPKQPW